MNKLELFKLLRKHINLSYRRSPAFEQNRWAKVLIGFGGLMFILYLVIYGVMIRYCTPYHSILGEVITDTYFCFSPMTWGEGQANSIE